MMKAQELRLGNLVIRRSPIDDLPFTMPVSKIDEAGFINVSAGTYSISCMMTEIEPIPLSAEWLERAGFKFEGITNWRHKPTRHHVTKITEGFVYRVPGTSLVQVQYVHQLQNLYFALTNQELDFTKK